MSEGSCSPVGKRRVGWKSLWGLNCPGCPSGRFLFAGFWSSLYLFSPWLLQSPVLECQIQPCSLLIRFFLGRPLGYFIFSLIGLKRTLSIHEYFSEALKGQPVFERRKQGKNIEKK